MRWQSVIVLTAVLGYCRYACACEPVLPFLKVASGVGGVAGSATILLAAIAIKSVIFGIWQKRLSVFRATAFMLAGNMLTTVIGVLAAAMIGSGPIFLVGFIVVWGLCLVPARRFLSGMPWPWVKNFTPAGFAGLMAGALAVSCVLFALSSLFVDSNHLVIYWIWKLGAVYLALVASILLTAFWEEWVIWRLSRCPADFTGYVKPVLWSNLIVLLCVMAFAAAKALPQRMKSPNHLISAELNTGGK